MFFLAAGFDSPPCHTVHIYLRLLPARESRNSHTAAECAMRCMFTRTGRATPLVYRQLVQISLSLGGSIPPAASQ